MSGWDVSEQCNLHGGAREGPEQPQDPTHQVTQLKSSSFPKAEDRPSRGKKSVHGVHLLLSSLILHDIGNAKGEVFAFFGEKF